MPQPSMRPDGRYGYPFTVHRMTTLLIAEDDRALGTFLKRGLEADGFEVFWAQDGGTAIEVYRRECPDLTILDLNLPVKDGEQVLSEVRALDTDLPILILTARQEMETRVRCLDHGADDLLLKPFSLCELKARCRALLRRKRDICLLLKVGPLELSRVEHRVSLSGQPLELTNKEFSLLEQLMLHRGRCVPRADLLETVWRLESTQTTNIVDVYINYLRRKLNDPPPGRLIQTIRGKGYRIAPNELGTANTDVGLNHQLCQSGLATSANSPAPVV